jgi:hypothetical protein
MTHTLHRQGTEENLMHDYLILPFPGRQGPDVQEKREQFIQTCLQHDPVNKDSICAFRIYVFDEKEKVDKALKELADAELGISIVVSGLYDKVKDSCLRAGLKPHTINYSLGFWGNPAKIPEKRLFEISSMCGHSLVSPTLALDMAKRVARGYPAANAAQKMAKNCLCEIFNSKRGAALLEKLAADINTGKYPV